MTEHAFDLESVVHGRVGTIVVGKYHLDRVIGIGGMAAVYAATHRNQAEFAVKMLHADVSSRDDIRSRFLREGYIANSVKHPGAVRVVDDDIAEDGSAFLVMELLDGRSVEDLWFQTDKHLPLRVALGIAHQLLDVLAAAHAKSIVHRDIKPANLFLTPLGDVKVLDFGIARLRDTSSSLHRTTQSGTMLGTPAFMAPEQARGQTKEVEGRTDLWAVGATLFSLVSGQLVHQAGSAPQLLLNAATTAARSLESVAPEVPASIVALVDKALAFDKPERWSDAAAMRDALREAFVEAFGEPPTRDALAAYFAEMEGAPVRSTSRPPAPKESGETPPAVMESAVETKLEGRPVPKLAKTLPLAQKAPEPVQRAEPARKLPETLPLGHTSPLSRSAMKEEALATAKPVSKEAPPVEPKAEAPAARNSRMPLLIGILVIVGLLAGVALLSMRGPDPAPAGAPPPAVSKLPAPSTSPSAAP